MFTAMLWAGSAGAADSACDRACLSGLADRFLASVAARRPADLPLAQVYRATENGVAAGIPMMNPWTTATGIGSRYYAIDPVSRQVFFISELEEGPHNALFFGRLKVAGGKFAEIEIYTARSRGDGGYQFSSTQVGKPAPQWLEKVDRARIPARAQLLQWGKSTFDKNIAAPPADPKCLLMENGKIVEEDTHVADFVSTGKKAQQGKKTLVNIPCGGNGDRPTDAAARTDLVDEEQGVVVSFGVVHGVVEPSLVENPTISAYVPNEILPPYLALLEKWRGTEQAKLPAIAPMPATVHVAEMHRYYDGKLQGQYLLLRLGPPGAHSPWVEKAP
jgi:hypothetical protein